MSVGESFLNSIALTIRATEKINQNIGSREDIVSTSPPVNSSLAIELTTVRPSASESGKGGNINVSV